MKLMYDIYGIIRAIISSSNSCGKGLKFGQIVLQKLFDIFNFYYFSNKTYFCTKKKFLNRILRFLFLSITYLIIQINIRKKDMSYYLMS